VTTYAFDAGKRLSQASLNMGGTQPAIVTGLAALETRGLAGSSSVDTALAYAKLDGPRIDVADTTLFWLDRLGAPRKIVDALGNATRIDRTDPNWPALATAVTSPTGFQVTATYDARANPRTSTEVNPLGDGRNATTSYVWDAKWDEVTKITRPQGDSANFAYDATTGNRLWQQDGRGSLSRVTFGYNANNQLTTITRPGSPAERIGYDATGNLSSITSAKGYQTTYQNDGVGRPTLISAPFDTVAAFHPTQQVYYDAADRDTLRIAVGPAIAGPIPAPLESLFVRTHYNPNGQIDTLSRYSRPNVANVGTITTKWRYDPASRRVAEIAPDGRVDSTAYDGAGNTIATVPRRGAALTFTMQYDRLNRLITRILPAVNYPARSSGIRRITQGLDTNYAAYTIPADTQTFTYDPMSRLLTANNHDARVKRAYYADGLLRADSLWIRTLTGANFGQHVYGLMSLYDLDGRRTSLAAPAQLVAGAGAAVAYTYDPRWGGLKSATDWQGNVYTFGYNARAELDSLTYPGQYRELFALDSASRVVADTIQNLGGTATPRLSLSPVRAMRYSYDAGDRLLDGKSGVGFHDTLTVAYSGLGHVVRTTLSQLGQSPFGPSTSVRYWERETFTYDALAHRLHATTEDTISSPFTRDSAGHGSGYQVGTGRLVTDTLTIGVTTYFYDLAGDVEFSQNLGSPAQERASYYAADGRLRAVAWRVSASVNSSLGDWRKTLDEYRYDALGRRIWLRSQKACFLVNSLGEGLDCQTGLLRRTVWDGDQELAEIQMPGDSAAYQENDTAAVMLGTVTVNGNPADANPFFGRAIYAPGIGLDRPLAVTRFKYVFAMDSSGFPATPQVMAPFTIMPFWTLQGDVPLGVYATGNRLLCAPTSTGRGGCVSVSWPYYWSAYDRQRSFVRFSWHGSLLEGKQDKSGLQFKRNRYYDPATGRFTQEDPIGLAGGLNLYGFANGDPVNSSDPFGLAPCKVYGNCTQSDEGSAGLVNPRSTGTVESTIVDPSLLLGSVGRLAGGLLGRIFARGAADAIATMGAASAAEAGFTSFASKAAAREAVTGMGLPQAQAAAVRSAISRATTKEAIEIYQRESGDVFVHLVRPGRNGFQVMQSVISPSGGKAVTQYGVDQAGRVVIDPKF